MATYKLECGHTNWRKQSSMEKHGTQAISRQNSDKRYKCKTCGKEFGYKIHLKTGREVQA
ncbi:CxxC motif protein [Haloarcula virus Hardyhisp2]|uniref:CxxC motif protein n=1 Tax=Haloarcula virus Hardyhisp2 TaxID=2811386 RepID=A0A898KC71_9VIRU|nr:CxxC motif protein [Haloarcula virus Hardyhisp2]QSJ05031.1 CxxC motif protein [Haloarcula virus Hardyhisp2]